MSLPPQTAAEIVRAFREKAARGEATTLRKEAEKAIVARELAKAEKEIGGGKPVLKEKEVSVKTGRVKEAKVTAPAQEPTLVTTAKPIVKESEPPKGKLDTLIGKASTFSTKLTEKLPAGKTILGQIEREQKIKAAVLTSVGVGAASVVLHPIKTVKGTVSTVLHPIQSGREVITQFKTRPFQFIGETAGAVALTGGIFKGVRSLKSTTKPVITISGKEARFARTPLPEGEFLTAGRVRAKVKVGKQEFDVVGQAKEYTIPISKGKVFDVGAIKTTITPAKGKSLRGVQAFAGETTVKGKTFLSKMAFKTVTEAPKGGLDIRRGIAGFKGRQFAKDKFGPRYLYGTYIKDIIKGKQVPSGLGAGVIRPMGKLTREGIKIELFQTIAKEATGPGVFKAYAKRAAETKIKVEDITKAPQYKRDFGSSGLKQVSSGLKQVSPPPVSAALFQETLKGVTMTLAKQVAVPTRKAPPIPVAIPRRAAVTAKAPAMRTIVGQASSKTFAFIPEEVTYTGRMPSRSVLGMPSTQVTTMKSVVGFGRTTVPETKFIQVATPAILSKTSTKIATLPSQRQIISPAFAQVISPVSLTRQFQSQRQISKTKQVQIQRQALVQRQVTRTQGIFGIRSAVPMKGFPLFGVPPVIRQIKKKTKKVKGKKVPFLPKYFSSIEARVFNIRGTRPTSGALATGIVTRPIGG